MWSNASWLMIVRRSVSPGSIVIVGFSGAVAESRCHITFRAYKVWVTSLAATDPTNSGPVSARDIRRAGRTQRISIPRVCAGRSPIYGFARASKPLNGKRRYRARRAMAWVQQEIRELKVNRYILVEEEPCRILSIQMSKPGKHGEAKARLEVMGLFDGQKRSIVHPVTHKVRVPMIDKRKGQVLSVHGEVAQLMDLQSYETFELPIPEDMKGTVQPGGEVLYMEAMGRRQITTP